MLVDEMVRQYGLQALDRLLSALGEGRSFEQAFAAATGMSFTEREPVWQRAVPTGGIPAAWLQVAQSFDTQRVLETVRHLCSSTYAGRSAGSDEAVEAARWIAERMAQEGIEPGAADGGFFQDVPITCTALTALPTVQWVNPHYRGAPTTGATLPLTYSQALGEAGVERPMRSWSGCPRATRRERIGGGAWCSNASNGTLLRRPARPKSMVQQG